MYERADTSARNYAKAAEIFGLIAKSVSSETVPEETLPIWVDLMVAIRQADDLIDATLDPIERRVLKERAVSFLSDDTTDCDDTNNFDFLRPIKNYLNKLSDGKRKSFLIALKSVLIVTEEIRNIREAKMLAKLSKLEGQLTCRLLLSFLPDTYGLDQKAVIALTRISRVGNAYDTFIDLPNDYKNGEKQISPNLLNRMTVLFSTFNEVYKIFSTFGLPTEVVARLVEGVGMTTAGRKRKTN